MGEITLEDAPAIGRSETSATSAGEPFRLSASRSNLEDILEPCKYVTLEAPKVVVTRLGTHDILRAETRRDSRTAIEIALLSTPLLRRSQPHRRGDWRRDYQTTGRTRAARIEARTPTSNQIPMDSVGPRHADLSDGVRLSNGDHP